MASRGANFLRADRKNKEPRFGSVGAVPVARIGARLLALLAALWHNWEIGEPGRHLSAYAH